MKKILGIAVLVGIFLIGCATTNEVAPSDPLQFEGAWKHTTSRYQNTYILSGHDYLIIVKKVNPDGSQNPDWTIQDSGIFTFTDKKITFFSGRSGAKYKYTYKFNEGLLEMFSNGLGHMDIGKNVFQKLDEPPVVSTSIRIEGITEMKRAGVWIFKDLPFNWTNTALGSSHVKDNSLTVNLVLHRYLTDNPSWEGMESSILWQGEGDYYMILAPSDNGSYSGPLLIYTGDDGKPLQYSFTKHEYVVIPFAQFKILEEL